MVCRKQDSQNIRPCEISSAGSPKSRGVGWASEPKGQRFCGHGGSPLGRLRLRLGLASLGCVGSLKSPKKSMVSIQQRYSLTRQRSELGHKSGYTKVLILCELQDRSAVLVTATAWALCPIQKTPKDRPIHSGSRPLAARSEGSPHALRSRRPRTIPACR